MIDLNEVPRDHEGTTSSASMREAPPTVVPTVPSQPVPTMIDVDSIEDDVIESSASAFAEVCYLCCYLLKVSLSFFLAVM